MTRGILPAALYAMMTLSAPEHAAAQGASGGAAAGGSGGAAVQGQAGASDTSPADPAQPPSSPTEDLAPPLDDASASPGADSATTDAVPPTDSISPDPTIRQDNQNAGATPADEAIGAQANTNSSFEPGFQLQADGDVGLTVGGITTGGVAAQAGLQRGDRIISIDGRTFTNVNEFQSFAPQLTGRQVPIVIERNGQQQTISVFYPQTTREPGTFAEGRAWLGVFLDSDYSGNGAMVSRVGQNSPAERAGVRSGDVILALNGQDVYDFRDLVDQTRELVPNSSAELLISRNGQTMSINSSVGRLQTAAYRGPMTRDLDRVPPPPGDRWSPSGYSSSVNDNRLERLERLVEELRADVQDLRAQIANSR